MNGRVRTWLRIRTPQSIDQHRDVMPKIYNQFVTIADRHEMHYRTCRNGVHHRKRKHYMLQTKTEKRTAQAALKMR
jgi:pyruvate,orthophosphate dikinase